MGRRDNSFAEDPPNAVLSTFADDHVNDVVVTLKDPALDGDRMSYQVEILVGAQVKRTLTSTGPSVSYSEAEQIADWGAPQFTYNINVYQLSASYGRGQRREAQINV